MRRTIDVSVSILVLFLVSPILVAVALAVLIDSRGSIFYPARRVGLNGRQFRMWKFRTMLEGAESMGSITGRNDPRVTRVGGVLRKTKLDELPQFVNVLAGDMTLVGPRPESPDMVARYEPDELAVLSVKPGITGRVQLEAGEESESIPEGVQAEEYYAGHLMENKLRRDIEYLRDRTPLSDIRILVNTVAYVFRCMGHVLMPSTKDSI